jgi:orotate phosphoribosyltransferase
MRPERAELLGLLREFSFRQGDFVLASGKRSSFYVDVRRTALTARGATLIGTLMHEELGRAGWSPRGVGGLTMGADPLVTATSVMALSRGQDISAFLVRKEPKGHGTRSRVEAAGDLHAGDSVVVLDDTVTSGASTVAAIEAAWEAGWRVIGAIAVVDRCEGAAGCIEATGVPFRSLFTVADLASG